MKTAACSPPQKDASLVFYVASRLVTESGRMAFRRSCWTTVVVCWILVEFRAVDCSTQTGALEFKVEKSCLQDPENLGKEIHYFTTGCTMTLACKYFVCPGNNSTGLTIFSITSTVTNVRTDCQVTVELSNMTEEHAGRYTCIDAVGLWAVVRNCSEDGPAVTQDKTLTLTTYAKMGCVVELSCTYERGYCPSQLPVPHLTFTTPPGCNAHPGCNRQLLPQWCPQNLTLEIRAVDSSTQTGALEFKVEKSCLQDPENLGKEIHYFTTGCTMTLACKYFVCPGNNSTGLTIFSITSTVTNVRTDCQVTVELSNMTEEHAGTYTCIDAVGLWAVVRNCSEDGPAVTQDKTLTLTTYAKMGCVVELSCTYERGYCPSQLPVPHLTFTTPPGVTPIPGVTDSSCSHEVSFTVDAIVKYEGNYTCKDTIRGEQSHDLLLRVGSPPVVPQNLTLEFRAVDSSTQTGALEFKVEKSCLQDPENLGKEIHYFTTGCTMTLACKYFVCPGNNSTGLTIFSITSTVTNVRTDCQVTVELSNMTEEHAGTYTCIDAVGLWAVVRNCSEDGPAVTQDKTLTLTTYAKMGCEVKLSCTYERGYCPSQLPVPHLTFTTPPGVTPIPGVTDSSCSHEVSFTVDAIVKYEGNYTSPPVVPQNLTLVFRPRRSLRLLLDKVKDGRELNDENTEWEVHYLW
ncbi:hypothetical protein BaRGS_00023519, partial [Batillaria attramentaria]